MMRENKMEFIKALEELCHKTRALQDLVIETGYVNYDERDECDRYTFVATENEEDVSCLLFRWKDQNRLFGVRQSIEGDSNYGILCDAMKVLKRMG